MEEEIFRDSDRLLDTIRKANKVTIARHGKYVTLERAIFLSWWCDFGDCKFCFMSTQKNRIKDPKRARRRVASILAEAEICNRIGWNIEFLSGGYGAYTLGETREIAEMVSSTTKKPVWINIGRLNKEELKKFGDEVQGIVGSIETMNSELHSKLCPSKPIEPVIKMLEEAKEVGFKTGVTIILGIGETIGDLRALFELIDTLKIDRVTYYSLNPHRGTAFEDCPPPSSLYQAGVIALTRLEFPDIKIIGGTWIDQLPNLGIVVLAGANGITKYPLFSMFGNRYGKKVEEEVKYTNRKLLGTFSDIEVLKGRKKLRKGENPRHVFKNNMPKTSEKTRKKIAAVREEIEEQMQNYIDKVVKG